MDILVVCFEIMIDIDLFLVGYFNIMYENVKGKYF